MYQLLISKVLTKGLFKLLLSIGLPVLLTGGFFFLKAMYDSSVRKDAIQEQQLALAVQQQLEYKRDAESKEAINQKLREKRKRSQQLLVRSNQLQEEWKRRAKENEALAAALSCELPPAEYSELCEQVSCVGSM